MTRTATSSFGKQDKTKEERVNIMNQFKFHSVGQGLFYTGSLANGNYNFVYDCGTESEQWYLDNCIKDYTREIRGFNNEKAIIDFVVISHLHKDHLYFWRFIRFCRANPQRQH